MKKKNEITAVVLIFVLALLLGIGVIVGAGALIATAIIAVFDVHAPFWAVWAISSAALWLIFAIRGNSMTNVSMKGKR